MPTASSTKPAGNSSNWANPGGITQVTTAPAYAAGAFTGSPHFYLMSSREIYGSSWLVGLKAAAISTSTSAKELTAASFGTTLAFFGITYNSTGTDLYRNDWSHIVFVGQKAGKGMYSSIDVSFTSTGTVPVLGTAAGYSTNQIFSDSTQCSSGICHLDAPTGGIGQFKGL